MNYYVRFPSEDNINILNDRCAEFKSFLIVETIKRLNISEENKRETLKHMSDFLKEHHL